jgi:hypothetical protein
VTFGGLPRPADAANLAVSRRTEIAMLRPLSLLAAGVFALGAGFAGNAAASATPDIPYTRFTLPNGLTVVVSEDHKAPIVAVSVWYHVGSGYEPEGKTGFAHLFEHLMFSGSENHKGSYFKPFELAGATGMNGTTWLDRTNYFETVPTTALDMALWMESDRMGHLLGAIGQRNSTPSAAWSRTRSARTRTSPTGACSRTSRPTRFRPTIPTTTTPSARWRI